MTDLIFLTTYNSDPYFNMALDEYFMELVDNGILKGVLRFFTWKPLSISLGYYQKIRYFDLEKIKRDNIKVVRRLSGGNAIFHKNDFTYSLIIRNGVNSLTTKKDYYNFIAQILKKGLSSIGIDCCINSEIQIKENNPDCFYAPSQYEIIDSSGKKLIGSAQKISRQSLLQHGSFFYNYDPEIISQYLTDSSPYTGGEADDHSLLNSEIIENSFYYSFAEFFNFVKYSLTDNDIEGVNRIIENRYSREDWTFRR